LKTTKEGQEAKAYLHSRGLTDDVIDYFNIGLSPKGSDFLYQSLSKHYDEKVLMNSGLFNFSEQSNRFYDAFQNRIMFPLTNDKGRIVAFSGRIWSREDVESQQSTRTRVLPLFLINRTNCTTWIRHVLV